MVVVLAELLYLYVMSSGTRPVHQWRDILARCDKAKEQRPSALGEFNIWLETFCSARLNEAHDLRICSHIVSVGSEQEAVVFEVA